MNYRKVMLIGCIGTMVILGGCKKEIELESKPIEVISNVNVATPTGEARQSIATEKPSVIISPSANSTVSTTTPIPSSKLKSANQPDSSPKLSDNAKQKTENESSYPERDLKETLEFFKMGLKSETVIEKLGTPSEKTKPELWPADGAVHQEWIYKNDGIQLDMATRENNTTLFRIWVKSPSKLKTSKNIGIGSTIENVQKAYTDALKNDNKINVGGSLWEGGIVFSVENGKVIEMFMGAGDE